MKINQGHARCIATGLKYIFEKEDFDYVIPMDGDGEDRPEEIKEFINQIESSNNNPIVGERVKRSEKLIFKICYQLHKLITLTFTGKSIKFGNYTCLPKSTVEKMIKEKATWNSFSGSLKKIENNLLPIPSTRASRYFGPSKIEKVLMLPDDMSGKEIVDRITTTDLFSTKKIFIIRDPQKIKGKASIDLANFCKNPVADCITVFLNDDWAIKSSFFSKIEANAIKVDVQTPFANDLKKWTKFLIKKRGKTASLHVENTLIELAGDSLAHLDNEIEKINNFLRNQAEPDYVDEILNFADEKDTKSSNKDDENLDELYETALEIIKSERKASTSFLQRKLQIGYNRAARIIDQMELNGEVSKANHVGKREVLK